MYIKSTLATLVLHFLSTNVGFAITDDSISSKHLSVITSSDPDSNANHSFVVVPDNTLIPQGIMRDSKESVLALQIPFVIEVKHPISRNETVRWRIDIEGKNFGGIDILSKHRGQLKANNNKRIWTSLPLDHKAFDRHRLVFRPKPFDHKPQIYKKGRGSKGKRRRYGGGTKNINESHFNPRLSYTVTAQILSSDTVKHSYSAVIKMDYKDMIRQEYINHYSIKRYGRGGEGNIPVPYRNEISKIPSKHKSFIGNPLSESKYGLLINDNMSNLIDLVSNAFEKQRSYYRTVEPLKDLNNKTLNIPKNKLWLSGGWRNPERNEWYSNALNSIHQRGGAVDIIAYEPPNHINSAITYWIIWNALKNEKYGFDGFFQLETNGRPMRTEEFTDDIEPRNGIPDAFDKADHLHINIMYDEK